MNASYVLIGSLLAHPVHFDRMFGMAVVYLLAVGVSAHSLDAMAPNKPWGDFLSRRQLIFLAVAGLIPALAIGLYYASAYALLLLPVGVAELFFLLAYNLELFGGKFHTNVWFAFSWGFLPVIAGFVVQTNLVSPTSLVAGLFGFFTAFIEINASRPYKALKKESGGTASPVATRLESILKGVVASVLAVAAFLLALAILG
jgi:4-hydroxybenzoate polyprenyltransferase